MMANSKAACGTQCICVSSALGFLGWNGSRQAFEIASTSYALGFMVPNERKLVNLSPVAVQFLEANGHRHPAWGQQTAQRYIS